MSYKAGFQSNNIDLQSLIDLANNLPSAGTTENLDDELATQDDLIAQIIAYTITAVFAFYFAKSRNHIAWMIAYVLFVIAIIVFLVLGAI